MYPFPSGQRGRFKTGCVSFVGSNPTGCIYDCLSFFLKKLRLRLIKIKLPCSLVHHIQSHSVHQERST